MKLKASKNIVNIYHRSLNIELMEKENIQGCSMVLKNGTKSAHQEEKLIQRLQRNYTHESTHFLFYLTKRVL